LLYLSFFAVLDALYIPLFRDVSFAYAGVVAFTLRFAAVPMVFLCVPLSVALMFFAREFSFRLCVLYALPVAVAFMYEHILFAKTQARLVGALLMCVMWVNVSWGGHYDLPALCANILLYWVISIVVVGPMADRTSQRAA
jgi:hypothetical protein